MLQEFNILLHCNIEAPLKPNQTSEKGRKNMKKKRFEEHKLLKYIEPVKYAHTRITKC